MKDDLKIDFSEKVEDLKSQYKELVGKLQSYEQQCNLLRTNIIRIEGVIDFIENLKKDSKVDSK